MVGAALVKTGAGRLIMFAPNQNGATIVREGVLRIFL